MITVIKDKISDQKQLKAKILKYLRNLKPDQIVMISEAVETGGWAPVVEWENGYWKNVNL